MHFGRKMTKNKCFQYCFLHKSQKKILNKKILNFQRDLGYWLSMIATALSLLSIFSLFLGMKISFPDHIIFSRLDKILKILV